MLNACPVASFLRNFGRSIEGRFVDPFLQWFLKQFLLHFGTPKLIILGVIFGHRKKEGDLDRGEVEERSGRARGEIRQRPGEG